MAKKRPEKKESSRVNSSTALQRRFPSSGRDIRRQRVAARVRCVERRKWESVIVAFEHRRGDFPRKITDELLHKFVAGKLSRRKMRHCTDITNVPLLFLCTSTYCKLYVALCCNSQLKLFSFAVLSNSLFLFLFLIENFWETNYLTLVNFIVM